MLLGRPPWALLCRVGARCGFGQEAWFWLGVLCLSRPRPVPLTAARAAAHVHPHPAHSTPSCTTPSTRTQGYGLTESCATSFVTYPFDRRQGSSVGPPFPCIEFRLEAVPEMGADPMASPARGEVCIRGDALFTCVWH